MSPGEVLALQRSMGNAAVSRLLDTGEQVREETPVQRRASAHDVLASAGTPLPGPLKDEMEARLGADFSDVRLHSGPAAQRSASEIGARAYTSGTNVVIGEGASDKHTLAHELTHVLQQREGPVSGTDNGQGLSISDPSDPFERAAEANAARVMSDTGLQAPGHTGHVSSASATGANRFVQRSPSAWRSTDTVNTALNLENEAAGKSLWPPVAQAIRSYLALSDQDHSDRDRVLAELEDAIQKWEEHQSQRTTITVRRTQRATKRNIIAELWRMIQDERNELSEAPAAPTSVTTPSVAIPIPGASSGGQRLRSEESDESSPGARGQADLALLRSRFQNVARLPQGVELDLHLTNERNLSAIHREGLRPGESRGIGQPGPGREPDPNNIYVLTGSAGSTTAAVSAEAGGGPVGVLEAGAPFTRDVNYPRGARQHPGAAPPVRDVLEGGGPFSFTLPTTPRTAEGITAFINGRLAAAGQPQITEDEAVERVKADLWRRFQLQVADYL